MLVPAIVKEKVNKVGTTEGTEGMPLEKSNYSIVPRCVSTFAHLTSTVIFFHYTWLQVSPLNILTFDPFRQFYHQIQFDCKVTKSVELVKNY